MAEEAEKATDYGTMDDAALESLMKEGAFVPESEVPAPAAPEDSPAPAVTDEPAPAEAPAPVEEAPAAPVPVEKEPAPPDESALAAEHQAIREKKFNAEMELQRAHASRLAGEIGHLREEIKRGRTEREVAPESYDEPDTPAVADRVHALEAKLRDSEIAQAIQEQAAQGRALMPADATQEEIAEATKPYVEMWQDTLKSPNPKIAAETSRAIFAGIAANLEEIRYNRKIAALTEKKAQQMSAAVTAKKNAMISGSGSAPAPKVQTKSYDDMTAEEADKELRRLYGRR